MFKGSRQEIGVK